MPLLYDIGGCLSQTLLLLRRLSLYCLATREMAAVFFCLNAKQYSDMSNKNKCANRRNVSVEKVQKALLELCSELASGKESIPVRRTDNAIIIYAGDGCHVNITFEKGGKA